VQHDRSPDDLRVGPWVPAQRAGAPAQPTPTPAAPAQPTQPTRPPAVVNEETQVLPVFVTGKKPEQPPGRAAMADTSLPPSERGMLLFVAALLGLGTIAVVAMMGFGLTGTKPEPPADPTPSRPAAVVPVATPSTGPSPSPQPSPSPHQATTSAKPSTAKRSPTAAPVQLGSITLGDVFTYCQDTNGGMPLPPGRGRGSWSCDAGHGQRQDFTPTDVCQWRYHDSGARATVGDRTNPATWRCTT
jgi:hypothetical protein